MIRHKVILSAASPTPPNTRRYPLSYVFSGHYYWDDGNLYAQEASGLWWSDVAYSDTNAHFLHMAGNYLNPQDNTVKDDGIALRCVSYFIFARRYPLSYVLSGFYSWYDGTLGYQETIAGYWWSTAALSNSDAYDLGIGTSAIFTHGNHTKTNGMALRYISVSNFTRRYPLSYVYSGNYAGTTGSMQYQGTDGYNWSTTAKDNGISYAFYFGDNALVTIDREYPKTVYFALRFTKCPSVSAFVCILGYI
ncbi:hypothetical protein IK112_02220 [Candidatus Saccharibacteria bacterium]|nr:hypothetical protein [Candidatus Saccharibacteria bacterium]